MGHGRSKKEAKNAAAKNLITQLDLSTLPQKPQRNFNEKKRKIPANGVTEGEDAGKAPKKRKGNIDNGYVGFNPGSMGAPGSGFGGFMGNDFMGQGMGFGGFM